MSRPKKNPAQLESTREDILDTALAILQESGLWKPLPAGGYDLCYRKCDALRRLRDRLHDFE